MLSRADYWLPCGDVQRRRGNVKNSVMLVQTCIFPGGGGRGRALPYVNYIGMCRSKGKVFVPFWSENGYKLRPFWPGIGYGFRGNYGIV